MPVSSLLLAAMLAAPDWRWSHADSSAAGDVTVRLIRGSVHVTTARQGSVVDVVAHRSARTSDPARVSLAVNDKPGAVEIEARYPRYGGFDWPECLPPLDDRGDFYHHDGRVDVDVTIPLGWQIHVDILACGMTTVVPGEKTGAALTLMCRGDRLVTEMSANRDDTLTNERSRSGHD